jgi:predicted nucleic acid-binding protein
VRSLGSRKAVAEAGAPYTVVLDAGAFIAFEKKSGVMIRLIEALITERAQMLTSAGVLAQVWRDPNRQGALSYLLTHVRAVDLTAGVARMLGRMMTVAKTRDVVDAHIVQLAGQYRCPVLTSGPSDLRRLDPSINLEVV